MEKQELQKLLKIKGDYIIAKSPIYFKKNNTTVELSTGYYGNSFGCRETNVVNTFGNVKQTGGEEIFSRINNNIGGESQCVEYFEGDGFIELRNYDDFGSEVVEDFELLPIGNWEQYIDLIINKDCEVVYLANGIMVAPLNEGNLNEIISTLIEERVYMDKKREKKKVTNRK